MKRLAFFALEGRYLQGPHEVWITLGRYATSQLARSAAADPRNVKRGVVETRIVPMYRVSGYPTRPLRTTTTAATLQDSVTVA